MQFSEIKGKGQVLQSQLFLQLEGVDHYTSLKETKEAEAEVWLPKQVHGTDVAELKVKSEKLKIDSRKSEESEELKVKSEKLKIDSRKSEESEELKVKNEKLKIDSRKSEESGKCEVKSEKLKVKSSVSLSLPSISEGPREADAVICNIPGQWIGIRTADCVPVLVYDPVRKVVAAIHAGWRGTVKHIVNIAIEKMTTDFGCQTSDLYAMIGPSISPEAFEVGEEVAKEFEDANRSECVLRSEKLKVKSEKLDAQTIPHSSFLTPNSNNSSLLTPNSSFSTPHSSFSTPHSSLIKPHIDLWQSNVMDLLDAGVELDHIDCTPLCTYQNSDILYSARKEGIGTGRIVTAIRIK